MEEIKSNIQRIKSEKNLGSLHEKGTKNMYKKWLIIFDIDQTLLNYDLVRNVPVIRPFVREFMKEFESECEFALWTKGDAIYADMVKRLFNVNWLFIWSNQDCVFDTKPLEKVTFYHPNYNQTNTIFIDDLSSNFEMNDGWYCILVPPFTGDPYDRIFEHLMLKIRNELLGYKNINTRIVEDYSPKNIMINNTEPLEREIVKMSDLSCGTIIIWHN